MMKYERLTKQNQKPKTIFCFSGSVEDFRIYKRLQELEDKIEQGTMKEIPENAVVLTREEFENLGLVVETVQEYESQNGQPVLVKERKVVKKSQTDFVELLNRETRELQISLQARKETAEKFAERAKEEAFVVFMGEPIIRASKIDEIAKEITEEL